MRNLKIGLICPYNITKGGGVQEIVLALQQGLEKKGHMAKIITPLPRDSDITEMPGVIFVGGSTDLRSPTHTTVQVSVTVDVNKIDEILKTYNFDILHFHEPWVPIMSKQILQRSSHIHNIATFHAKVPETQMSRTVAKVFTPYLKSVLTYINNITAVSTSAAEYVSSLTDQKINIVPNGVDLNLYHSHKDQNKSKKKKNILYIGRLERRKGVRYLLHAFQLACATDSNLNLIIAGDGPEREMLTLLAEDLGITNIEFLGYVTEKKKIQLLKNADLFCSPAIYGESFGIVLLEAMAMNLITIAGNNSGYIDVMKDNGAISIINPRDSIEFSRRILLLLGSNELQSLWLKWAENEIKQYNYPHIIDLYEELYYQTIKQNDKQ